MIALLIGFVTALAAAVVSLLVVASVLAPRDLPKQALLRLYPDLLRLMVSLCRDPRVGRRVRWRLFVAVVYDAQPFNLIPDFVPVIGLADNVVVTAWAIRSALRTSGRDVVLSHWHGTAASFVLVCKLCSLNAATDLQADKKTGASREPTARATSSRSVGA